MILKPTCFVTSNDLLLFNTLLNYKSIDDICGSTAIEAFTLHMWYLTDGLVPFALFSSSVDSHPKQKMVEKLKTLPKKVCSKRFGHGYGKPPFLKSMI